MNKYNRGGAVQAHRIRDDGELRNQDFRIDDLKPRTPQRLNWWKPPQIQVPELPWQRNDPRSFKEENPELFGYWCNCRCDVSYRHPRQPGCLTNNIFGCKDATVQPAGLSSDGSPTDRGSAASPD